jgi:hypothetical protein
MDHYSDRLNPPNPMPHIVLPVGLPVSHRADANGNINALYRNGISVIDEPGGMAGFLAIGGLMGFALASGGLSVSLSSFGFDLGAIVLLLIALVSLSMLRADMIGHRHSPVLFDRAARKVHLFVSQSPSWWQLWRWTPTQRIESFDWSCIRAEVVEIVQAGGAGVPRKDYALTLAVVQEPGSTQVRARFGVGLGYPWSPEPILSLWEHLRLFMTAKGPHLAPGDTVFVDQTEGFWRSLGFLQPLLSPGAKGWLTGTTFSGAWWFSLPFSVFALVMLPLSAACGLIRWITLQLRREPHWPDEILNSVGEKIDTTAPRVTWTQRRKALKAARNRQ